jgi:hypothetical protein
MRWSRSMRADVKEWRQTFFGPDLALKCGADAAHVSYRSHVFQLIKWWTRKYIALL